MDHRQAMLPLGIGAGLIIPPLSQRRLVSVPPPMAGVASSAFNASRQVRGAIGVALFGSIISSRQAFIGEMHLTLATTLAAALLAIALSKALQADSEDCFGSCGVADPATR